MTEPDLFFIVHGSNAHTWWRRLANGGYPWWRRWSLFSCAIRKAFRTECEIREFRWTGDNTHQARVDAGAQLARAIEKEPADRRIHVIGHSHGGNVALSAVNQLPPGRVASIILLANPNIATIDGGGRPPEWFYWGDAVKRVGCIWNLYSTEDFVQTRLAERFHGIALNQKKSLLVRATYGGSEHTTVCNGEIHWKRRLSAHRSMHSEAMGTVVGSLVRGEELPAAMKAAGLSLSVSNEVRDRGGWPGDKRMFETIREIADPTSFEYGKNTKGIGVLFVHGFTASPAEMRPIARSVLARADWRCVGLLLPGHGTSIEDMQHTSAKDWHSAVENAYERLSKECDRVFLVGLSLGAVLACHVAVRRSRDPKLRGLILMAPAFGVTKARAVGIRVGRLVYNVLNKGTRAADYFLDHRLYSYLQIPLNLAAEVLQLGREAVTNMGKLRDLPVIMFVGDRESTVSLGKMLSVSKDNPWIRLVRLPRSRHILTVEPDREIMFEATVRFMEECLGNRSQ